MKRMLASLTAIALSAVPGAIDAVAREEVVCNEVYLFDTKADCVSACARRYAELAKDFLESFVLVKNKPKKVVSCTVEKYDSGKNPDSQWAVPYCAVKVCGVLYVRTPLENARIPGPDFSRYTRAPAPRIGPPAPGLLEGDSGFSRNAPSATGTPIAPSGGAASTGTIRGGSQNVR